LRAQADEVRDRVAEPIDRDDLPLDRSVGKSPRLGRPAHHEVEGR
jgi:hypothetical protein